jgi:hypothetical protein
MPVGRATGAEAADRIIPGQVSISARALNKVVTAVAADELRVSHRDVAVRLSDDRGLLAVAVVAPLRLAGLASAGGHPGILQRCQTAQSGIRSRTAEITGSAVRTVAIRVTRARILAESRVA